MMPNTSLRNVEWSIQNNNRPRKFSGKIYYLLGIKRYAEIHGSVFAQKEVKKIRKCGYLARLVYDDTYGAGYIYVRRKK